MRMMVALVLACAIGLCMAGCSGNDDSYQPSLLLMDDKVVTPSEAGHAPGPGSQAQVLFIAYVSTPADIVDRMLKMANVTREDVLYDLGCGDGRIVVAAAKRYRCRAVGYDLDRLRVREARTNAREQGVTHLVAIRQEDVLKVDLHEATVVTLYMGEEMNARLIPQLRTLGTGARIVSHDFGLADIPPDKVVEIHSRTDDRTHKLYLWNCPLPANR